MKITKLNLVRIASLTILAALAAVALYAPAAVKAGNGNNDQPPGLVGKDKKPRHRELLVSVTCDGACLKSKGYPGEKYCIEATCDINHPDWQPICAEITTTDGHIEFTDTCASNYPSRFYRVCWSADSVKTNNGNHYGTEKHAGE